MRSPEPEVRGALGRGELVRLLYRLGRHAASGVLTLTPRAARPEVFVLRRGAAVCVGGDLARRGLIARLARSIAAPSITAAFDDGVTAYPPGAPHQVSLAGWARSHLEAQLDAALAEALVHELTGARLALRPDLAPEPLDEADRRMLAAMAEPRRLDQIWPVARTPRFRLLAFLHFLRAVDALEVDPTGEIPRPAGRAVGVPTPRARASPIDPTGEIPRPAGRAVGVPTPPRSASPIDPTGEIPRPAGRAVGVPTPPRSASPIDPIAAEPSAPVGVRDSPRADALRLLGLDDAADADAVKRAYRRLARALHPDLQPGADAHRRRMLERRFAEVTAAYEALL